MYIFFGMCAGFDATIDPVQHDTDWWVVTWSWCAQALPVDCYDGYMPTCVRFKHDGTMDEYTTEMFAFSATW